MPVKPAAVGKSRLVVEGVDRIALARAIALDTIAAAAAAESVAQVVVVTDDALLPVLAADIPGLRMVPEGEAKGLNAAVAEGARHIDGMPRAALLGDLPALRPGDLDEALSRAEALERCVVADADGTGSTLVTAAAGVEWESHFGPGSFAEHVSRGCTPLEVAAASTLRHDVDTSEQLRAADGLGLGPRTSQLLRRA
jgi:2-phospho-L-lactate guanylyltransferase